MSPSRAKSSQVDQSNPTLAPSISISRVCQVSSHSSFIRIALLADHCHLFADLFDHTDPTCIYLLWLIFESIFAWTARDSLCKVFVSKVLQNCEGWKDSHGSLWNKRWPEMWIAVSQSSKWCAKRTLHGFACRCCQFWLWVRPNGAVHNSSGCEGWDVSWWLTN